MPEAIFVNRAISTERPGFADKKKFFMQRSPGPMGGMFSPIEVFSLPTPVFLDTLYTGLTKEDANALEFLYGNITNFTGAREVLVSYNREGYPLVQINGDKFPNTNVCCKMTFLWDSHIMGGASHIFSNGLLLHAWERWRLEDLKIGVKGVELDIDRFYRGTASLPDIRPQIHNYPELVEVLKELQDKKASPLDILALKLADDLTASRGGNYRSYSGIPLNAHQQQIMERFGVFGYCAEVRSSKCTLNQMVRRIKILVRGAEESYFVVRDMYKDGRYINKYAEES